MIREASAVLVALAASSLISRASASEPPPPADLAFVADLRFGMESGVITVESARQLLLWSTDRLEAPFDVRRIHRVFGVLLRSAELLLLDLPLVEVETGFVHEVFGHGARARELDVWPSYVFKMPRPYRWMFEPDDQDEFAGRTQIGPARLPQDYELPIHFGGIEANATVAHRIARDVVRRRGIVRESDLLVYAANKLVYAPSFLDPDLDGEGGDDVFNYVQGLRDRFNRWRPEDAASVAGQLRTAYLWNFADPLLVYAVYATVGPWLALGESVTRAPLPRVGRTTVLPLPRFGLTPFGAEHVLGLLFARDTWTWEGYGRVGSSGLASYVGAGVAMDGLRLAPTLSLGFDLDGWRQPELLLRERNTYERNETVGGSAALRATWMFAPPVGVTGKLAVKSRGYLSAQPIDGGAYGWAGFAVQLPGER